MDRREETQHRLEWQRAYEAHRSSVWGYLVKLGAGSATEDLTHNTFIEAFRSWDTFRGESSRCTWLCRIAYYLLVRAKNDEQLTRQRREQMSSQPPDDASSPDEELLKRQRTEEADALVAVGMAALDPEQRHVLALYYGSGATIKAIADELGVNYFTAQGRLKRAREAFRAAVRRHKSRAWRGK